MKDRVHQIVNNYCDQIKTESLNYSNVTCAVKSIDNIVQQMYRDLYGICDIRYKSEVVEKLNDGKKERVGHCC